MEETISISNKTANNANRPAFPTNARMNSDMTGLTKREVIAKDFLVAMLGCPDVLERCLGNGRYLINKEIAQLSIQLADDFLNELHK